MNENNSCNCRLEHVHEIVGSTFIAEYCKDPHNHRFATVSDEAIPYMGSHVHNIKFRTDSYDGHYHEFCGTSSAAIPVGGGKHIHFAKAHTTYEAVESVIEKLRELQMDENTLIIWTADHGEPRIFRFILKFTKSVYTPDNPVYNKKMLLRM